MVHGGDGSAPACDGLATGESRLRRAWWCLDGRKAGEAGVAQLQQLWAEKTSTQSRPERGRDRCRMGRGERAGGELAMQWRRMIAVRLENARFERSEDGGSACGSTTSVLWAWYGTLYDRFRSGLKTDILCANTTSFTIATAICLHVWYAKIAAFCAS